MTKTVIKVENLSKYYRLGLIGGGTFREDVDRWIAKIRGKPDPLLKIGQIDHGNRKGDQIWALKDVNFEVKLGEILGIIGRNGAGKSTLLKILSKITAPSTGRITIKGRVGSLLEVGTGFHPELTGRENIYLNGTILGMKKTEVDRKLEEIVEFADMTQFVDTPVKRYSSGMTVRLAFAVAAHLEPEILIVDEVLAVGDAAFQKKCLSKMKDVAGRGRTVLFVSHNMSSIRSLCSSAFLFDKGTILSQGESELVVGDYLSLGGSGAAPLSDRKDRQGRGEIRFTDIQFLDSRGVEKNSFISGDSLEVKVFYDSFRYLNPKNFVLSLEFWDRYGRLALAFMSDEMGCSWNEFGKKGVITLKIDSLALRAADFYIRIYSNSDRKSNGRDTTVDVVENVKTIVIEPGDFWNTGFTNRRGGYPLLPGAFSHTPSSKQL